MHGSFPDPDFPAFAAALKPTPPESDPIRATLADWFTGGLPERFRSRLLIQQHYYSRELVVSVLLRSVDGRAGARHVGTLVLGPDRAELTSDYAGHFGCEYTNPKFFEQFEIHLDRLYNAAARRLGGGR